MKKRERVGIYGMMAQILRAADAMAESSDKLSVNAESHVIDGRLMACVPVESFVTHISAGRMFFKLIGDLAIRFHRGWPFT